MSYRKGSYRPHGTVTVPQFIQLEKALESAMLKSCGVDQVHQDAMKLYLDSWVVSPLRSVLHSIREKGRKATK